MTPVGNWTVSGNVTLKHLCVTGILRAISSDCAKLHLEKEHGMLELHGDGKLEKVLQERNRATLGMLACCET